MKLLFSILFIGCYGVSLAQTDLQKGLRLYYPFSGSVTDSSGNNNNPSKNNTDLTEDRFGKANSAVHFNGRNTVIIVPDAASLHMEDQISLCVWIKPLNFYKGKCHVNSIMMKGREGNESGYFLRYDDNIYRHDTNGYAKLDPDHENFSGNGINYPPFEPYVQTQEWQCLIYTHDGKFSRIYINGKMVKEEESVLTLYFTNKSDLFIGKMNNAEFPYWINADLDDLRIYDRAISQDEVNVIAGVK